MGSIYLSTVSTNPKTLLGFGTWVQITDRFLLAAGSTYKAGATGGEAKTTKMTGCGGSYGLGTSSIGFGGRIPVLDKQYGAGSDLGISNMPPYLVVYVWKRTA